MRENKIRILHVAQAAGGVDCYIRMLLKYLDKEKFENIMVCSQDFRKEDYNRLADHFEQIEMTRAIGVNDLKVIKAVRKLIKKYNPDIVYAHSSKAGAVARVANIGIKNYCIYNPHGWAFNMKCSAKKKAMYNTVVDTIMLWATVKWTPKKIFSFKAAIPLIQYSWKVMMTDLIGTLCNNLGSFIIGAKYNSADLAYYTKGNQLPQLFRTNIYTTLISVLFPGISAVNDDMIAVKKITRKSVRIMAYIVFPISLGLMVAGDTIVKVLFTEKWLPMLPYVYVTCVETIISVPATIALQPIKAVGRSDLMLKFEIIKKVFFIVSTIVAMNFGVFAIALTVPANTLLDLIINANINKKLINYSFFEELSDCLAALILSLIMAVVVAFIGKIEFNIYIKVVIQIMVGGLCYAGLSYLTRNKEFSYILNVGMKHFKKA